MDSFYGGHEGVSFLLRASFDSYDSMVAAFQGGSNYTDVWFDEYCIIDTPNKNDPDNGKIYKRGLNYQDQTTGGAIYLGQIVGPSSGTPWFQMTTIPDVVKKSQATLGHNEYRRYPIGVNADGTVKTNWEYDITTNSWSDKGGEIKQDFNFSTANDMSLVPGKTNDGKFNDEIKWTWCNIRRDDTDKDSYYYVGFQIPYTVIDYAIHQTSPYDKTGNILTDATEISRVDTEEHPFYEKWDLGLPKGIKGDTLRNLKVEVPKSGETIYTSAAILVNSANGMVSLDKSKIYDTADDIAHSRQIVTFELYIYDKQLVPSPIKIYLGNFNIIKGVQVADDGTLTVSYTHEDNTVFTKKIKWVNGVTLSTNAGSTGGHFQLTYNNGSADVNAYLTWVRGIEIDDNGSIIYTYVGRDTPQGTDSATGKYTVANKVKWIKDIELNPNNGHFKVIFNNGATSYETYLDWVKDVEIDEATGDITITSTRSSKVLNAKLKLLTDARVSTDGVVTLGFNTGNSINIKESDSERDFHIKHIENVFLNTGISADKHINVKYNYNGGNNTTVQIGNPINDIDRLAVRPSDWHLLVLYSDVSHRVTAKELKDGKDGYGNAWVDSTTVRSFDASVPEAYGSDIYWKDLGAIKDQAGILIGFNITKAQINEAGFQEPIEYLNKQFPTGLTGEQNQPGGMSTKEKIVTYTPKIASEDGKDDKEFYAFDYNLNTWYYLGKIADSGIRDVVLTNSTDPSSAYTNLSTLGLAFMKESVNVADTAIPQFWKSTYKQ